MQCFCVLVLTLLFTMANRPTAALSTFYQKLGNPRFISAPMVDHSSLAWRLFVRKNGCDLTYTEMLNSLSFARSKKWRAQYSDWKDYVHVSGSAELTEQAKQLDRPLVLQFAGNCPELLVKSAKHVERDALAVDLNLGCPQKVAKKGHFGAYLMHDKSQALKCLSAMVQQLDCPITAKVRVFDSDQETLDFCRAIEDTGVSLLTVHGRTIGSCNANTGPPNWNLIRDIKSALSIPVVANGGIGCYADAINCLEFTRCDGVMASEALLENPKLFSEEGDFLFRNDFPRAQMNTVKEFVALMGEFTHPTAGLDRSNLRGHLFKMLHRIILAPQNRDMLLQLSRNLDLPQTEVVVHTLDERLQRLNYDEKLCGERGLINQVGFYMRHRVPVEKGIPANTIDAPTSLSVHETI